MRQVLIFRVGEGLCGLDIVRIREVVEDPVCHYLPRAPHCCEGAINVRGQVLPLINLSEFLGGSASPLDRRCIVLDVAPGSLALRVTALQRIVFVAEDELSPGDEGAGPLVMGTLQIDDRPVQLLDAGAILQGIQQIMGDNACATKY
jgi:chemotaxis signal transduction protein